MAELSCTRLSALSKRGRSDHASGGGSRVSAPHMSSPQEQALMTAEGFVVRTVLQIAQPQSYKMSVALKLRFGLRFCCLIPEMMEACSSSLGFVIIPASEARGQRP